MLLSLEYISKATGIDNKEVKKLFIYEYVDMIFPTFIFVAVLTNNTVEIKENKFVINLTQNQFFP